MADNEFEGKIDAEGKFELTRSFWKTLGEAFAAPKVSRRLTEAVGRKKALDWYSIRSYDLGVAREDEFVTDFPRDGDMVLVLECENQALGQTFIKFDNLNSDAFDLAKYRKLRHNFSNLYLTNTASPGHTLYLLLGRGDWDVERHYPQEVISAVNADMVDSLHASASVEAGKLLALGSDGFFPCGAVRCLQNETFANRPATPAVGDTFISVDTSQTFVCYTAGAWTEIGITTLAASLVIVADAGGYYANVNVESVLQELGPYMADVDGFPDELKNLITHEIQQLETLGGVTTISALQWGYLGGCTGILSNIVADVTPQLGGELDCQAHSVGFTQQTATGDGTTTIDWRLGNKFFFTFGAMNETFTFTAPSNPCNLILVLKQDAVGGNRTATWLGTVKWPAGTAPTLSTGTDDVDIIAFYYDGTDYYGLCNLDFS